MCVRAHTHAWEGQHKWRVSYLHGNIAHVPCWSKPSAYAHAFSLNAPVCLLYHRTV